MIKKIKSWWSWKREERALNKFKRTARDAIRKGAGMRDLVSELMEIADYKEKQELDRYFNDPVDYPECYFPSAAEMYIEGER